MSNPSENFHDPYQKRREALYDAAIGESRMLAAVAAGFLMLGTMALLLNPGSEAVLTAFQGITTCSYIASTIIGGWSFFKYAVLENPRQPEPIPPLTIGSKIGQLVAGFFLGLLAWATFGITLLVVFIISITQRRSYGMLLAGAFLGAIFPPLAIFVICGMR